MVRRAAGFVSKKAHRKSRGGCLICKRKKVKCDESQPACGYCSLRKLDCEYLQDSASAQSKSTSISSASSPALASLQIDTCTDDEADFDFSDTSIEIPSWLVPAAFGSLGQLTLLDHELLHHYKTSTWKTFAIREDAVVHTLHRDSVPQLSLSHSYLMYALLSIAASHSNSLQPSKELENQALVYRQKTFQAYAKALENITAESYETILVTGTFLLALIPPPSPDNIDDEHLEWMYSILKMSEGLRVLASIRWAHGIEKLSVYPLICREIRSLPPPPWINAPGGPGAHTEIGPLGTTPDNPNPAPTYQRRQPLSNPVFLPPPLMALLESIINPVDAGAIDFHRATLKPVFHALSPIFLSLYYYHLNQDFYVRVFVMTSFLMPDFLALVKAREPRALTLVAWWFALANLVPQGWWVGRCVGGVVGAIGRAVSKCDDSNGVICEAINGVEKIVLDIECRGREEAAKGIFDGWEGVHWHKGPSRAEEWEFEQMLDLSDDNMVGFDIQNLAIEV